MACDACRLEVQRLSAAGEPAAPAVAADLNNLLGSLRGWESSASRLAKSGEALKHRVASAIEPYLGKEATDALLAPVREDGRDLLSQVAPLLTMFLGRRAAGPLVSHIVETAIVRL
jgi:hypothetical protein